jgi:DNA-binding GntR family transcriptional regulator
MPQPSQLPSVKDEDFRTAHEVVSAALRRAIVSGALSGGTKLVQTDLAAELGVSTTPIREAIRDLVAEGLSSSIAIEARSSMSRAPRN